MPIVGRMGTMTNLVGTVRAGGRGDQVGVPLAWPLLSGQLAAVAVCRGCQWQKRIISNTQQNEPPRHTLKTAPIYGIA